MRDEDKVYEIMIVDDIQENLQLLSQVLSAAGYRVRNAIDGETALMGVNVKRPDLILLDIKMPEMDGYEVCRRLKSDAQTASIPIIFLSALGETQDKMQAFESGGVDYITKPFEAAEVLARVQTHLELYQMKHHLEEEVQARTKELHDVYGMLAHLEDEYRQLVESFQEDFFFYTQDSDGNITYISPYVTDILGYEPEELLGHYSEYMTDHPVNQQAVEATQKSLGGERQRTYEMQLQHKDGSVRWFEVTEHPIVDGGRHITRVEGVAKDITARKTTEEDLRMLMPSASMVLSASSEAICGVDREGRHTFVNPTATAILGYAEQELIGQSSHEVWHYKYPDGTPYVEEDSPIYKSMETGEPTSGEEVFFRKDGSPFHATFKSQPLIEEDKVIGAVISFRDISEQKHVELSYYKEHDKVAKALKQTVMAVAALAEKRDPYTAGHQQRVAELSVAIARDMGLDEDTVEGIRLGGYIHDIGKIYVPAEILTFPGKLDANQFAIIKSHPEVGYEIIKDVEFPWPVAKIIHQHHERINGSGYPQGLKGDEISLEGRIVAVADVVESMASHRPYRAALGVEVALDEIKKGRETLYDADVVDHCVRLFEEKGYSFESHK